MIPRVFVDSDVILDVALAREPFLRQSRLVLAILENGKAIGHISPNIVTNLYYILRKAGGDTSARRFLAGLLRVLTVVSVDHAIVMKALQSGFADFEDAVQNWSAVEHQCSRIVTRNRKDYRTSELVVQVPSEFLRDFTG